MTDTHRFTSSPEALYDIEMRLQEPLFTDVPLGSTLNDVLSIELEMGARTWSLRSVFVDVLRCGYHALKGCGSNISVSLEPGRYLLTWLNERASLRDLVLPVIDVLGPSRCTVIGPRGSMRGQLPNETQFLTFSDRPLLQRHLWLRPYLRNVGPWLRRLVRALDDHNIPKRVLPRLMDHLLIESQRIVSYRVLLDQLRPLAVLTEYDRNAQAAPLILAARTLRIPTLTMVHGAISAQSPFGWTPLLADYVLCWGPTQREVFEQRGVSREQIIITGRQSISREIKADRTLARRKAGLPLRGPLVLLATTSPIDPIWRHQLVEAFCEGMTLAPGVGAVVRLHPSEQLDSYHTEIADHPEVRFLENGDWSLDEAMAACDIVVVHYSTFAVDALVKGRPVIVLDVLPERLYGQSLIDLAGCPAAHDSAELAATVTRLLRDASYLERCRDKAEEYVMRYCARFGVDAARCVAASVEQVASSRRRIEV